MVALDTLVVSTALGTIRHELGASIAQLEWTVNAYNLSLAVLLMPAAALGDRFGRRRLFAAGLALFTAASAAAGLAPDVTALIAARAVQGAGAALVLALGLSIVSAAFAPGARGKALGIVEGITGLATIAGPVIGGAVAQGISWEWIFWVNVPIGLVAIPLVFARIEESVGSDTALDGKGLALVAGGALGIVWGLVRGNEAGWGSAEVLASMATGVALVVAFVIVELRAAEPMLPMRFFRSRGFSGGNAAAFLLFASMFSAVFFLAQFLQNGLGYSPFGAGLRLLPWTACLFFVAPLSGALADRIGSGPLLVGGLALQAVGMGWIALVAAPDVAYGQLVAPLVLAGIGASAAIPPAANAVIGAVPDAAVGKAAGANSMLRELGGVFGVAIAVAVFAGAGSYASAQAFSDGFVAAMAVAAGLSLAGAVASSFIGMPTRRSTNAVSQRVPPVPRCPQPAAGA